MNTQEHLVMSRKHLLMLVGLVLVSAALSAGFAPVLPETVPTHWNVNGQPDAHGSKWLSLLLFPGVQVGMLLLLIGLPLLGPFRRNFEQFRVTYGRICVTFLAGFVALQLIVLLNNAGHNVPIGSTFAVVIGVMFAVLGNWLGKVRRNFYVGIRTPWTLANEQVWEKTHRLGGKLFVIVGLASAVTGLVAPQQWIAFVVLIGGLGVAVIWLVLYSLYWYRRMGKADDLSSGA